MSDYHHYEDQLIVFDGIEGCGKSTQSRMFVESLKARKIDAMLVRDPGTTRIGELIRGILLNPDNEEMANRTEVLLYMAARAQMMDEIIAPSLVMGQTIVCDRFISSTFAYQCGHPGSIEWADVAQASTVATGGRMPNVTVILDMPVDKAIARVNRAKDRIEQRPVAYHEQVRQNFLTFQRTYPDTTIIVNADRPVLDVIVEIIERVDKLLRKIA